MSPSVQPMNSSISGSRCVPKRHLVPVLHEQRVFVYALYPAEIDDKAFVYAQKAVGLHALLYLAYRAAESVFRVERAQPYHVHVRLKIHYVGIAHLMYAGAVADDEIVRLFQAELSVYASYFLDKHLLVHGFDEIAPGVNLVALERVLHR